jgi:holo-[acyl-carrier protein] synthase
MSFRDALPLLDGLRMNGMSSDNGFACGVDIVSIKRILKAVERSGDRFLERIFSSSELLFRDDTRFLATRFAAKEAFFKALGRGVADGIRWLDFSLPECNGNSLEPVISGKSLEYLMGRTVFTSVSSNETEAVAVVYLEGSGDRL